MTRRPDLDPVVRAWEPVNVDQRDWPQHIPSISRREDPWRGDRFMRVLIAMQSERNAAFAAREAAKMESAEAEPRGLRGCFKRS